MYKKLIKIITTAILSAVFLCGCQNHINAQTTAVQTAEAPAAETPASESPASKPAADEPSAVAAAAAEYVKITAAEAITMMDDGEDYILLDVRTEEEYNEKRIDGAILIPDTEIKKRAPKELPDKEARILIYCRSGRRSALAAQDLIQMGYTQVYDFGGIIDWPYETVGNN